jgi:hypothetical protein
MLYGALHIFIGAIPVYAYEPYIPATAPIQKTSRLTLKHLGGARRWNRSTGAKDPFLGRFSYLADINS